MKDCTVGLGYLTLSTASAVITNWIDTISPGFIGVVLNGDTGLSNKIVLISWCVTVKTLLTT